MQYLLGTADVDSLPSAARPGDYARSILEWFPNAYPFTAMLAALKRREKASDSKFSVFETDIPAQKAYTNGQVAADGTSITVDDGAGTEGLSKIFRKNSLVVVGSDLATGEVMRVTEDPSTATAITVERGFAGTGAKVAIIPDDTVLTIIGVASADGEASPSALYDEPDEVYNYLQIFEHPWAVTRRRKKMATRYGTSEDQRLKRRAYFQHALDREKAFLFGRRSKSEAADADNAERTTTGGLAAFVDDTNVHDGSSTNFTKANWDSWIYGLGDYGSQEKVASFGGTAWKCFHQMIEGQATQMMEPFANKWGFRLTKLRTAGPDLMLMKHPLMTRIAPGDIIIADLTMLTFKFLDDFITQDVVLNNVGDGNKVKKQFYSDCGLAYGCGLAHGHIKGITTYTSS